MTVLNIISECLASVSYAMVQRRISILSSLGSHHAQSDEIESVYAILET